MLPPFHISNLRVGDHPQDGLALIELTKEDYENMLASHPKAALRYLDSDHDTVTVGSSTELSQFLEDENDCPSGAHQIDGTSSHTFTIANDQSVQQLWGLFWQESQMHPSSRFERRGPRDIESSPNANSNFRHGTQPDGLRKHYFDVSRPPRPCDMQRKGTSHDYPRISSVHETRLFPLNTNFTSHLTEEGKRQAQSAGISLHARNELPCRRAMNMVTDVTHHHKRWESYKGANVAMFSKPDVRNNLLLMSDVPDVSRLTTNIGQVQLQNSHDLYHGQPRTSKADQVLEASTGNIIDQAQLQSKADIAPQESYHREKVSPWAGGANRVHDQASNLASTNVPASRLKPLSLLEVFEAELVKHRADDLQNQGQHTEHRQTCGAGDAAPFQPIADELEASIRTAVQAFESCIRGLVSCLQAASKGRENETRIADTAATFLSRLSAFTWSTSEHVASLVSPNHEQNGQKGEDAACKSRFNVSRDPRAFAGTSQYSQSNNIDLFPDAVGESTSTSPIPKLEGARSPPFRTAGSNQELKPNSSGNLATLTCPKDPWRSSSMCDAHQRPACSMQHELVPELLNAEAHLFANKGLSSLSDQISGFAQGLELLDSNARMPQEEPYKDQSMPSQLPRPRNQSLGSVEGSVIRSFSHSRGANPTQLAMASSQHRSAQMPATEKREPGIESVATLAGETKAEVCAHKLQTMGYNIESDRLRMYANLADGDVGVAVDTINEDECAYDRTLLMRSNV